MVKPTALALHAGAGIGPDPDYQTLLGNARGGWGQRLHDAEWALDLVVSVVETLKAAGRFIGGRGASPNMAGLFELDAAVMDSSIERVGAIGALAGRQSPDAVACAVLTETNHSPLVGRGAGLRVDERVAVACAGLREYLLRTAAAAREAHQIECLSGAGGLIAVDAQGRGSLAHLGAAMTCAVGGPNGRVTSHIFSAPLDVGAVARSAHKGALAWEEEARSASSVARAGRALAPQ